MIAPLIVPPFAPGLLLDGRKEVGNVVRLHKVINKKSSLFSQLMLVVPFDRRDRYKPFTWSSSPLLSLSYFTRFVILDKGQ